MTDGQGSEPELRTPDAEALGSRPLLDRRLLAVTVVFVLALGALTAGIYLTRNGDPALEYNAPPPQLPNTAGLVDQQPLSTARSLATLAATKQEQEYARQALELSDHEVDQAFAAALHEATAHPPPLTGAALHVAERLAALAPQIVAEQQQVAALEKAPESSSGRSATADATPAGAQLQLAEAQLALDQDERDDLEQDLVRLGGDRRARIQQALDEHEALQKQASSLPQNTLAAELESQGGLRTIQGKIAALQSLRRRHVLLQSARAEAISLGKLLSQKHDQLEKVTSAGALAHPAPGGGVGQQTGAENGKDSGAESSAGSGTLVQLHALADQRKTLAQLDQRVHEEQQLAELYQRWDEQVLLGKRTVLHRLLVLAAALAVLLALMVAAHILVRHTLQKKIAEQRRRDHLRVILETTIEGVGAVLVLLALFGPPQQVSAILGLATAGIAFVMKDFVVSFFGWFVLMGRGGLRVGDLVEIQGVGGEVVELGLMRTVLFETTGGTDVGHPTGRRVAFMNSYAIEGRFFNFSTVGQWLWDELVVNVAAVEEAAPKAEAIRLAVAEETRPDAAIAENEWRQTRARGAFATISAAPAVSLRPAAAGIDVIVHYVTRASHRYETRTRLYNRAIEILHFGAKGQEEAVPLEQR